MHRILILLICIWVIMVTRVNAIDYIHCHSIEDAIVRETEEIACTHFANHDELSQLYVSRGESYLFDAQYEKAIDDFDAASYHIGYSQDFKDADAVAFRAAFGKVVSCDNLGLHDHAEQAIQQLQKLVDLVGCDDCVEHMSYERLSSQNTKVVIPCKHKKEKQENHQQQSTPDNYNDINGPDVVPPNWCEEVITGVGRSMDAIACLAPNYG